MDIDLRSLLDFAKTAIQLREEKKVEDVLRHNLSSWLPRIFISNPTWINEHVLGTEEKVTFESASGSNRGFVDSLVGKTAVEYEKDIRIRAVYSHGYDQVKDYCAGLLNKGVLSDDIVGILSDTVKWYAYKVNIINSNNSKVVFGRNDIELIELDNVFLDNDIEVSKIRWIDFMIRYFARQGARELNAKRLAHDMGIDSIYSKLYVEGVYSVISKAFIERKQYAQMIESLWTNFILYIGGNNELFSIPSYANEFYIITLAKLLCANIIEEKGLISDEQEITAILTGNYFTQKGFLNLVEYDYFGWINSTPYIKELIPIARGIQENLLVYDYKNVNAEDMFGSLISGLANREQRILLGQEETPQWLAQKMVSCMLEKLEMEKFPRFIDMCCGSGVFIVETLKQTENKYLINIDSSQELIDKLVQSSLGFDVDPLAVMLARVNWVIIMRKYVSYYKKDGFIIPIFHADSLFIKTPITDKIDANYEKQINKLNFGGKTIILPSNLLNPNNRRIYDYMVHICHSIAMRRADVNLQEITEVSMQPVIEGVLNELKCNLNENEIQELREFGKELIYILEKLQREGLNGIWSFILSNTYRPALVSNQFNGIVSNPPWLAMSKLRDNPYKHELISRAERFSIKPYGAAHLHIELATVFLIQAIAHYLEQDAIFACILPDSILNGYQHEPFRKIQYEAKQISTDIKVTELWEIDEHTFKNKAIVLIGNKVDNTICNTEYSGKIVSETQSIECNYKTITQGKRSAWTRNEAAESLFEVLRPIHLSQGADIMFRTWIFFDAKRQPNEKWNLKTISKTSNELGYLMDDVHGHLNFNINTTNIDDKFIYQCYLSKHLIPFGVASSASAFIPLLKENNQWKIPSQEDCIVMGKTTLDLVEDILMDGGYNSIENYCAKKLNYRNKLTPQIFWNGNYIILSAAGGAYPCAAFFRITNEEQMRKTIIDQTLYWSITNNEDEAVYVVGMLNSQALAKAIAEFQPEGIQGRRHIHTLPYSITPSYDRESEPHKEVVIITKKLIRELYEKLEFLQNLDPSKGNLRKRRNKIRGVVKSLDSYLDYEEACKNAYGI